MLSGDWQFPVTLFAVNMLFSKLINKAFPPNNGRGNHTAKALFIVIYQELFDKSPVFSNVHFSLDETIKYGRCALDVGGSQCSFAKLLCQPS